MDIKEPDSSQRISPNVKSFAKQIQKQEPQIIGSFKWHIEFSQHQIQYCVWECSVWFVWYMDTPDVI